MGSAALSSTPAVDNDTATAGQWRLIVRRFLRHRLATVSALVVIVFYTVAIFADFLACADPRASDAVRALAPPQSVHWIDDGRFRPFVYGLTRSRNPDSFDLEYRLDRGQKFPVVFFARGYSYRFLGLLETDVHLFGVRDAPSGAGLLLMGADALGRDLYSRVLVGLRTSLFIGLAAVFVSLALGTLMGVVSGFYGGAVDVAIQRLIEILRAVPTVPLWMALAAAVPPDWGVLLVYLTVTLIIALIGWTELARELRGRILALRNEDYVLAAELCGAGHGRIMLVHLLPSCVSHIIATTTLALPAMIASETALGFLGLGLRPPAISLGVLLNGAQSVQSLALYPWLMWPAAPTALIILAFNFLGDGLRDAADPYA